MTSCPSWPPQAIKRFDRRLDAGILVKLNCCFHLARLAPSERSESRGEMSEWLKEHAWKAKSSTDTDPH